MTYRATGDSSSLSSEERAAEARRIVIEMGLANHGDVMTSKEKDFVERLANDMELRDEVEVSIKQLWWLRDLKDKYL